MMGDLPATIDIVIADDHSIFREGLRKLLEAEPGMRVVAEASDGEETVKAVRQYKPTILLLDLSMPNVSGLDALRDLSGSGTQTYTIVLSAAAEQEQVIEALQLGARGIVLKHSALQLLLKSIRCVCKGEYWVGSEGVSDLVGMLRRMKLPSSAAGIKQDFGLTSREKQVIALVLDGYTNKDLARKLEISESTAKHHLTNIFNKLGVSNRLELVLFEVEHRPVKKE